MKIDGKESTGLEEEIKEAERQLNIIFNKILPLKKDDACRLFHRNMCNNSNRYFVLSRNGFHMRLTVSSFKI